jgi:hypothetical protein
MKSEQASRSATEHAGITALGTRPDEKIKASIPSRITKDRQVYEDLHAAIKLSCLCLLPCRTCAGNIKGAPISPCMLCNVAVPRRLDR